MMQLLEAPVVSAEEEAENTLDVGITLNETPDYFISDGIALASSRPFVEDGRAVRFNPKAMAENQPYPFMMSGCWFIAMKRSEGHIDFFFVQ